MKSNFNKFILIVLICAFITLVVYGGIYFRIEIAAMFIKYKNYIHQFGVYAPIVYIILFALSAIILFPPAGFSVYTFLSGLLFGVFAGTIYSFVGFLIGASVAFLITRNYAPHKILSFVSVKFDHIITHIHSDKWFLVAILRLIPVVPIHLQNYLFGFTRIGFVPYILTTAIFIVPKIILNNYIGSLGEKVFLNQTILQAHEWAMVYGSLLLLALLVWFTAHKTNHYLNHKKKK